MGEELLINFNDSLKIQSLDGPKVEASADTASEVKFVPDYSPFLGCTKKSDGKVASNIQEKCILDNEYDELIPQLNSPMRTNRKPSDAEDHNLIALSPFGSFQINRNNRNLVESTPTNLMSPFGCPEKAACKGVAPGLNSQISVPTGQLLSVQDESKSPITIDVFDVEALEENCKIKSWGESSDIVHDDDKEKLALPSISSIGSGESQFSSCGAINNGFLEANYLPENDDLSRSPNESVLLEAQAIAMELSRLAKCETNVVEGIESETGSILSNSSDLDDIDIADMKLIGNELDGLLDTSATEQDVKDLVEEDIRKIRINTPKMEPKNSSESLLSERLRSFSSSSSLSISPLPLSTERLSNMKLKATEPVEASVKLASLKNTLARPIAAPGRTGPLKALVPLSQMVKNSVSPVGVVSAKPRSMKMSEASPDFLRPVKTSSKRMSSTPVLNKPQSSTKLNPVKKGLNGNVKGKMDFKPKHEATSTPSGQKSSIATRSQEAGKQTGIARPVTSSVTRKAPSPSPLAGKRYSNSTPNIRTPVARSSSTGQLPLTPSLKKVNGSVNTQAFASPLRRANSLSGKLSAVSPCRPLKMSANSPAKGGTPLDKLISKFRRVSVSRGMKENVSPQKY